MHCMLCCGGLSQSLSVGPVQQAMDRLQASRITKHQCYSRPPHYIAWLHHLCSGIGLEQEGPLWDLYGTSVGPVLTVPVLAATSMHGCLPLTAASHYMLSQPPIRWPQLHYFCPSLDQSQALTDQMRCSQQQSQQRHCSHEAHLVGWLCLFRLPSLWVDRYLHLPAGMSQQLCQCTASSQIGTTSAGKTHELSHTIACITPLRLVHP